MKVVWTFQAKKDLRNLFEYYLEVGSASLAKRITKHLVERSKVLTKFPKIGPIEKELETRTIEYRYLIAGNQKLIYWIESDVAYIATVFDCQQDPLKIQKRIPKQDLD